MRKRITIDFSKAIDPEKTSKEKTSKEQKSVANKKTDEATSKSDTKKDPPAKEILARKDKLSDYVTESGTRLTVKEEKFINAYIEHGNQRQAVIEAGYVKNNRGIAGQIGGELLRKQYIKAEIDARLRKHEASSIAGREEIMQFFSDMMRGKILDQFDLPTTNGDKIKAAVELAKRSVDIEDKIRERTTSNAAPEIKISLKWDDMKEGEENNEQ